MERFCQGFDVEKNGLLGLSSRLWGTVFGKVLR